MKVLVLGGTGATGRFVVKQLLGKDYEVVAITRSKEKMNSIIPEGDKFQIIEGDFISMGHGTLKELLSECSGAISCLGHNLTLKGIYGKPRKLVRDSVKKVYEIFNELSDGNTRKIVLMNTTGNRNKAAGEKHSFGETLVTGIIRGLLPPHSDNEEAAGYLQKAGLNDRVQWVAVRPDSLVDSDIVTDYEVFTSPVRSPIFDPGKTFRINVADFMVQLYDSQELWEQWKGELPVIYNKLVDK